MKMIMIMMMKMMMIIMMMILMMMMMMMRFQMNVDDADKIIKKSYENDDYDHFDNSDDNEKKYS